MKLKEFASNLLAKGDLESAVLSLAAAARKEPTLMRELARAYLQSIAPAPAANGKEQTKEKAAAKEKAATKVHSRGRIGRHMRPSTPTAEQKAGALKAEHIFNFKLRGGTRLGDVKIYELRTISEQSASIAGSFLSRGYADAVEAIAVATLSRHCVAADPAQLVKDVIKPSVAAEAFAKARIEAAERIAAASAKVAHELVAASLTA